MKNDGDASHDIWFWQLILSPHMSGLAISLSNMGHQVTCVVARDMSEDRLAQGWIAPEVPGVVIHQVQTADDTHALIKAAAVNSIHFCEGVRANAHISEVQRLIARRGLRQFVVMETVDDAGWLGVLKRLVYRIVFVSRRRSLSGVLCIGQRTTEWVIERGVPRKKAFPFAYFLAMPHPSNGAEKKVCESHKFRFVYIGQLIERKRVSMLLETLSQIENFDFELTVVGAGPQEAALKELAAKKLRAKVDWVGQVPMADIRGLLSAMDCLVLPSFHDGWGAVCSEALMSGTPVICSDSCGAAGAVLASGVGGVFPRDNQIALRDLLIQSLRNGKIKRLDRESISAWGRVLSAEAGAFYLLEILKARAELLPPWNRKKSYFV